VGVAWSGQRFSSSTSMRNYFARHGVSWEAFLSLHASVARQLQLTKVSYGETFYTKEALARWLAGHGQHFQAWAKTHSAAAAALAAQPANTATSDRLAIRANTRVKEPGTLRVLAHAFPGAHAEIVVRAGSKRLAAVGAVVNETGQLDSLLKLSRLKGQRRLNVSLTVDYPEGARTARVAVRRASALRSVSSK
jgi:hypothetical protein